MQVEYDELKEAQLTEESVEDEDDEDDEDDEEEMDNAASFDEVHDQAGI